MLPGRQGRLPFGYLALSRHQPVSRDTLIDALWGEAAPADAAGALSALVSKIRAVVGAELLRGRTELTLSLPEPAHVDVEVALSTLHAAESAVAVGDWRRAWAPTSSALFVAQRTFLPEADAPWADVWRRRLEDVQLRAMECYANTCLELEGTSCQAPSAPLASLSSWPRCASQDISC